MKGTLLSFIVFLITFFCSCKKSTTSTVNSSIQNMKVYKDSLTFTPIRMVAGSSMLACGYNTTDGGSTMLVTDLKGNKLFSKHFDPGLLLNDFAFESGNSITALAILYNSSYGFSSGIYLFRYSASGTLMSADSLFSPSTMPLINDSIWGIPNYGGNPRFFVNAAGNYIIYGFYYGFNWQYIGVILELTHDNTMLWKQYIYNRTNSNGASYALLSHCIQLSSGDYILSGYYPPYPYLGSANPQLAQGLIVTELDVSGKVLWQKNRQTGVLNNTATLVSPYMPCTSDIVYRSNGNFICNVFPNSYFAPYPQNNALLYEISPSGNFVDSVSINFQPLNSITGITNTSDGGLYVLMNVYFGWIEMPCLRFFFN